MKCSHLIFVVIVLTKSSIKCRKDNHISNRIFHNVIVNAVNKYREDLMCLKPVIGLNYISESAYLIDTAKGLLNNPKHFAHFRGKQITSETCDYIIDLDYGVLANIEKFINNCLNLTNNTNNSNLIWMWSPSINAIGCVFGENNKKFIFCVVNDADETIYKNVEFEKRNVLFDIASNENDGYINLCNGRKLLNLIKSCFLRQQSITGIIQELNKMRNEIAVEKNYTNFEYVEWDYDLEIAAIEVSRFDRRVIKMGDCFITKKFGNATGVWYYEHGNFTMSPDLYTNLIPILFKNVKQNIIIEIGNLSGNAHRQYGWMYDAKLRAIGCTFFKLAKDVHVLCLFNRDPEYENAWNTNVWNAALTNKFQIRFFLILVTIYYSIL